MKKILIIDDEQDLCFLLKNYFTAKQYEVQVANTLKDGVSKLKSFHPDILFLDNMLPDGAGWDIACRLSGEDHSLKINLMTGQPDVILEQCDEHFTIIEKPLSYTKLDKSLSDQA